MRKKRQKTVRNLYLPSWVKLRATDSMMEQAHWIINEAEECNADSVAIRFRLKKRPWDVILKVKRVWP